VPAPGIDRPAVCLVSLLEPHVSLVPHRAGFLPRKTAPARGTNTEVDTHETKEMV
jgi:hypothetical protein